LLWDLPMTILWVPICSPLSRKANKSHGQLTSYRVSVTSTSYLLEAAFTSLRCISCLRLTAVGRACIFSIKDRWACLHTKILQDLLNGINLAIRPTPSRTESGNLYLDYGDSNGSKPAKQRGTDKNTRESICVRIV
jgi:hypothetical protein